MNSNRSRQLGMKNTIVKCVLLVLILLSRPSVCLADEILSCHDGDTCRTLKDGKLIRIRLSGIDAPELDQPYGEEARQALWSLVKGANISLSCRPIDPHMKRFPCGITKDGQDIQATLVKQGAVWDFGQYSGSKYASLETEAKLLKKGLWSAKSIISPFCWRHSENTKCQDLQYQP